MMNKLTADEVAAVGRVHSQLPRYDGEKAHVVKTDDKSQVNMQFKSKDKKKSFFTTGDAVCLVSKPDQRLLVVDAGIDVKAGPWVAVRETKTGVSGMEQWRFVVKPGELKAWSEEARRAALNTRRQHAIRHNQLAETTRQAANHVDKVPGVQSRATLAASQASARASVMSGKHGATRESIQAHASAAEAHRRAASAAQVRNDHTMRHRHTLAADAHDAVVKHGHQGKEKEKG